MNLRVPGPTPLPPSVVEAMTQPMIGHRTDDFRHLMREVQEPLRAVFGTRGDVLILTASGTGGLEAAITNLLSPGDWAVAACIGAFGERFADIAEAFGVNVRRLEFPVGEAADPVKVADALRDAPPVKALLLTHNETMTGVTNDVPALIAAAREVQPDIYAIVDGVSSVAAMPMLADAWGCDAVVTASQKALMAPPGLALVALSERAWTAIEESHMPRFYWDFKQARKLAQIGETPFTPAVSALQGLRAGLRLLMEEGLEAAFERHRHVARLARDGLRDIGFAMVADERHASPTVTAAWVPEGVDADALLRCMAEQHGVIAAPGHVKDKTIRLAHMGWVSEADMRDALEAVEASVRYLRGE